ncbi:hypothetical protein A4A49_34433 [Nicotiana attenuata]|uniref:Disease resistance protein n=1 Tax=Nicotiana attenuata TaxID=49451 RepID=A0A1J6IVH0_NICAT|nr:hypothetical protein A4A49_34433 [Nicotiana attenuata]
MLEWKQWHVLGNGEQFPILQKLSIKNCPKLIGKLPENHSSLTSLTISNCPELNLETPIQLSNFKKFEVEGSPKVGVPTLEGMKQIVELCIIDCHRDSPISQIVELQETGEWAKGVGFTETPLSNRVTHLP